MNRVRLWCAMLAGLLGCSFARALDWESTSATLAPRPGRDVVLATYRFANHGKSVVHMLGIQTSCGCTDAVVNPTDVPVGGTGTVEVVFTIGRRTGHQVRDVFVQSDDAKTPTKLTLTVDIPTKPKAETAKAQATK